MFESVVTMVGLVDVAAVETAHEARGTDGTLLCFSRDAESGTVTVHSPGDPAVAVLAPVSAAEMPRAWDGQPAVDVPSCTGHVHMVVDVRRGPPGAERVTQGSGCGGSGAPLGRRGATQVAGETASARADAGLHAWGVRAAPVRGGRTLLQDTSLPFVIPPNRPGTPNPTTEQNQGGGPTEPSTMTGPEQAPAPAAAPAAGDVPVAPEGVPAPGPAAEGEEDADLYEQTQLMNDTRAPTGAGGLITGPAAVPPPDAGGVSTADDGGDSSTADFMPIIIGIAAGLVLFALLAVCFLWYRRSQRNSKQFTVSKRPDGYEYSHAYAPPSAGPPQPPPPPPESHLSVQAHHPYASHAKQPPHLSYAPSPFHPSPHDGAHRQVPPAYHHDTNGKDPVSASAAAAAYASQSAQPGPDLGHRHAADSPASPASPAMYSPQAPTPTHTPPLPSGDHMEEVNEVPRHSPLADADGRRVPAATSQTAPILSRKHDSKHAGRTHKQHKPSTAKARKDAFAAHGRGPATAGIAAMHEAPPVEEPMPLSGDVIALPIAKPGTVDDEIQDKIIWLESQLDAFGSHGVVSEMFKLVSNARLTQEAFVTQHAVGARDQLAYVLTFYLTDSHFEAERSLYRLPALRGIVPRCEIYTDDSALHGPRADPLPPCIVFERGETLAEWLRRRSPDRPILAEVLLHVALRMRTLHRTGYAHCNITPSTVKWFPRDNMWKLAEFHHAARCGDPRRSCAPGVLDVSPHYAAPETLHKSPQGSNGLASQSVEITARPALDVWSFGVMALEILCGFRLMDDSRGAPPEVLAQLQGETPLPWEPGHNSYSAILEKSGDYAGPLLKALNRDPAQRPSVTWITEQWRRVQDSEHDPSPTGEFL